MKFLARLLALIGLHSTTVAAPPPAGAQPPFESQLWHADHVVLAVALGSAENMNYRLQRVLKGDPNTLRLRQGQMLDIDDSTWRLLGKGAVAGDTVLMFLHGLQTVAPAHDAIEFYPLDARLRFTHAPGESSVRRTLTVDEVERILGAPPFNTRGCGRLTVRGEYVLCTEILQGGTRSEGRVGRLYRYGVEVKGVRKGQIIDTEPTGGGVKFIFLGSERPHLWSTSGWDLESNPLQMRDK